MQRGESPVPHGRANTQAALALDVLARLEHAVISLGRPADATLSNIFHTHREYGSRDRRFLANLVFSYFRWRGWLSFCGDDLAAKVVPAWFFEAEESHAAIELIAARARPPKQHPPPLKNETLEAKAAALARWIGRAEPLPIASLVPAWLADVIHTPHDATPERHLLRCVEAFQERPPTWLRISQGRKPEVVEALRKARIEVVETPLPAGLRSAAVAISGAAGLRALPRDARNSFQVQDLASQCVGLVCDPKPGERWWDVCAGSGGKTLHLADLMNDKGELLATDVRPSALAELCRRSRHAGASAIKACLVSELDEQPGEFDGVLVDAPCSGIGTWSRNPDARWRTSVEHVKLKAEEQARLLRQGADVVRRGGLLVYSVCTITRAESESVVEGFLKDRPEFDLESAPHPLFPESATSGHIWIWPWDGPCDGMFVARMRRAG